MLNAVTATEGDPENWLAAAWAELDKEWASDAAHVRFIRLCAAREALDQAVPSLGCSQQYGTPIRTRVRLIERGDERAIEEVRKEHSLWYCRGRQRRRLRRGESECGNRFLPRGGVCVSTEIGPFVNCSG